MDAHRSLTLLCEIHKAKCIGWMDPNGMDSNISYPNQVHNMSTMELPYSACNNLQQCPEFSPVHVFFANLDRTTKDRNQQF